MARDLRYWVRVAAGYLAGQGLVQAVSLVTGLVILWCLPVGEYAVYVVLMAIQGVGAGLTDMGANHALIALGAPSSNDKAKVGKLYRACQLFHRRMYPVAITSMAVIALGAIALSDESRWMIGLALGVSVLGAWGQRALVLDYAVLNIFHDARGLWRSSIAAAGLRLVLVGLTCSMSPTALAMQAVTVGTLLVQLVYARFLARQRATTTAVPSDDERQRIRRFVAPLIPGVAYGNVQGHVGVWLLALFGSASSVAEVGALGRLGQLLSVFSSLNTFLLLPAFARQRNAATFMRWSAVLVVAGALFTLLVVASAAAVPEAWLVILGNQYSHLEREVWLAVLAAMISVGGGTVYFLVASRGDMRWQWLSVPLGVLAQGAFLIGWGVGTPTEAIIVGALPSATYLGLQLAELVRVGKRANPVQEA